MTTCVVGVAGERVTYTAATAAWVHTHAQGGIVGTTDVSGVLFAAVPRADEYGRTTDRNSPTPSRLDWLGNRQRYGTGIICMRSASTTPKWARSSQVTP